MLPRPLPSSAPISRSTTVGPSGSVLSLKPMAGMPPDAGGSLTSTLTAFRARGAATATAVTVERDSASKNRPRPALSLGRSKYIFESDLRAKQSRIAGFHSFSLVMRPIDSCGIDNPTLLANAPMSRSEICHGGLAVGLMTQPRGPKNQLGYWAKRHLSLSELVGHSRRFGRTVSDFLPVGRS